jgi:hypothetical protein
MSFNISYIFEAQDQFSTVARKISGSFNTLTTQANKLSDRLERTHRALTGMGGAAMLRLTAPISAIGIASVKAAADVEKWTTQWGVYTHNVTKATEMTRKLMQWAKFTPFRIPDIQRAGIILGGLMDPLDKIPKDLKELANVAAMTGMPLSVLATNFGKVISAQKLMGIELMELRRIGVAVIPAFNKLNAEMGKPPAILRDLVAKGRISANDFRKIIEAMAGDTGIYAHGTEKIAQTLIGMYTTVRDNMFLTRQAIGDQIVGITNLHTNVRKLNAAMTRFTTTLKPWIKAHQDFAAIAVETGIILSLLGPTFIVLGNIAWAAWGISKAFGLVLGLARVILKVILLITLNPIVLAIGLVITGIVLVLHHFYTWSQILHGIKITLVSIWNLVAIPIKPVIVAFKVLWVVIILIEQLLKKVFTIIYKFLEPLIFVLKVFRTIGSFISDVLLAPLKLILKILGFFIPPIKTFNESLEKVTNNTNKVKQNIADISNIDIKPLNIPITTSSIELPKVPAINIQAKITPIKIAGKIIENLIHPLNLVGKVLEGLFKGLILPIKFIGSEIWKHLISPIHEIKKIISGITVPSKPVGIATTATTIKAPTIPTMEMVHKAPTMAAMEMTHKTSPFTFAGKVFTDITSPIKFIGKEMWKHLALPAIHATERMIGMPTINVSQITPAMTTPTKTASPVAVAAQHAIRSHLAIAIHDPGKFIKSVVGTTPGTMNVDTGTNMMMSRI